ncbi:MAG: threonine synthase [Caldisericaceae bacterium]|nr:threonine synthase [Caldisericaceae bacterium]
MKRVLKCVRCGKEYPINVPRYLCDCGGLLDVKIVKEDSDDFSHIKETWKKRRCSNKPVDESGVWRFRELVYDFDESEIVTFPEGKTNLYELPKNILDVKALFAKHEGENPTGSFKDRGMTIGISFAKKLGYKMVICASTGNTSASLAAYAAKAGLKAVVFIPDGKIAFGKLSQALAYGAKTLQIKGDFDDAMNAVREIASKHKIYLLNSLNPIRLEGQKTIMIHTLEQLNWEIPDWFVLPGGNLGNTTAFGKALYELKKFGIIEKVPRLAVIQAENANPFYSAYKNGFEKFEPVKAETIATAIRIGNPVNYEKAKRSIEFTNGVVEEVSDEEIMNAKAVLDRSGTGCEPASAASLAGAIKLRKKGVIKKNDKVVILLTGNILKDPGATTDYHLGKLHYGGSLQNAPEKIENSKEKIEEKIKEILGE